MNILYISIVNTNCSLPSDFKCSYYMNLFIMVVLGNSEVAVVYALVNIYLRTLFVASFKPGWSRLMSS